MLVSRCRIWIDGKEETSFKSFSEDEQEIAKMVKLMSRHVVMGTTPPYTFKIDYVKNSNPRDFRKFKEGTFVVELENGGRLTFSPASTLKVGEYKVDDENEIVQSISFGAENRYES